MPGWWILASQYHSFEIFPTFHELLYNMASSPLSRPSMMTTCNPDALSESCKLLLTPMLQLINIARIITWALNIMAWPTKAFFPSSVVMASLLGASSDTASSRSSAEVECIWSLRCFNLQPVLDAHAYSSINWFMERNNLTILVNHCIESGDNILWELIFSVVPCSSSTSKHFADVTKDLTMFACVANNLKQINSFSQASYWKLICNCTLIYFTGTGSNRDVVAEESKAEWASVLLQDAMTVIDQYPLWHKL